MDSFIFSVCAVAPIVLTVLIGYFLKSIGMMKEQFAKDANKLVFRVFMPVMLFLNIYKIKDLSGFNNLLIQTINVSDLSDTFL